jgi:hypothetical protein
MHRRFSEPTPTCLRQRTKRLLQSNQNILRLCQRQRCHRRKRRVPCDGFLPKRNRPMRQRRPSVRPRSVAGSPARDWFAEHDYSTEPDHQMPVSAPLKRQQRGACHASPSCSFAYRRPGGLGWRLLHRPRHPLGGTYLQNKAQHLAGLYLFGASSDQLRYALGHARRDLAYATRPELNRQSIRLESRRRYYSGHPLRCWHRRCCQTPCPNRW